MGINLSVWLCAAGIWNLFVLAIYGIDKWKAVRRHWRIPERVLLTLGFMGGGPGAVCGMLLFHHKVGKWTFRILVPMSLVVSAAEMLLLIFYDVFLI